MIKIITALTIMISLSFSGLLNNSLAYYDPTVSSDNYYYVSLNGDNSDGKSWSTAWNELDQIQWNDIEPGDRIILDGGTTVMIYQSTLAPTASGTESQPIYITKSTEPGHNGKVHIFGGRSTPLPECGQLTYPSFSQRSEGIDLDASYLVIDGMEWDGIQIYGNQRGVDYSGNAHHVTLRNLEIYDNGSVSQDDDYTEDNSAVTTDLYYSGSPGIRIAGYDNNLERMHVHDNGTDSIQSGPYSFDTLDRLTISQSWFHNERIHSGIDNSPPGDEPDEMGAPSEGPNYNHFDESFNWCTHSDAMQIQNGGVVDGHLIEDSLLGPGFTNTLILGDDAGPATRWAQVTNMTIRNTLILKGADSSINSKPHTDLSKPNTAAQNFLFENITIISYPNTKGSSLRTYGNGHQMINSIIYDGNIFLENGLTTDTGNCVYDTSGHSIGSIFTDPQFTSITNNEFAIDDYSLQISSPCIGKGSSIRDENDVIFAADKNPTPTEILITPTPVCNSTSCYWIAKKPCLQNQGTSKVRFSLYLLEIELDLAHLLNDTCTTSR